MRHVTRVKADSASTTGDQHQLRSRRRQLQSSNTEKSQIMIKTLIVALVVLLISTFPATWMLMLFLGNLGLGLSYWGTLPLGILVSALLGGVSAPMAAID
jgi:4-hydroxybenzoate polyprenyltransferase